MTIQRWSANWHMEMFYKSPHGDHVNFDDHVASHAFDEAKERELFEAAAIADAEEQGIEPDGMIVGEDGDYVNSNVQIAWWGWKSCAKSRAAKT